MANANGLYGGGRPDFIALNRFSDMMENALASRAELMKKATEYDRRRNLHDECGYPEIRTIRDYYECFRMNSYAARVVEIMPKESWMVEPSVFEIDDVDKTTAWEKAFYNLPENLSEEPVDYFDYSSGEGNPIFKALRLADQLCGIGRFGGLLIGCDDGRDLRQPLQARPLGTSGVYRKLTFLRAFDESMISVKSLDKNPRSRRFGRPEYYNIYLTDSPVDWMPFEEETTTRKDTVVHWSRILHMKDHELSSSVYSRPRQEPVFERLLDIRKLLAGSAEMYWKGAFPGISIETHPTLGGDVAIDASVLKDRIEQYQNSLQRYLVLLGMSMKTHPPQVVDPKPQIDAQVEALCVWLGCPKRIFLGSERGQLASEQDEATWSGRLRARQIQHINPEILIPFINRLITFGMLPIPDKKIQASWPDMAVLSEDEKATIAVKRTQALTTYVKNGAEAMVAPLDFLTRFLMVPEKEALHIIETAQAAKDFMSARLLMELSKKDSVDVSKGAAKGTSKSDKDLDQIA